MDKKLARIVDLFGLSLSKRAKDEGLMDVDASTRVCAISLSDPTSTKSYTKWLVQRYCGGGIERFEDIDSRAKPLLARYDELKKKNKLGLSEVDILRIVTLNDLQDIVEAYSDEPLMSKKETTKEEEKVFYKSGQAILFHDDDEVKVVIPKTEAASCYFGRNTRWCTAATKSTNYFEYYNKNGNLYIVLIKKENKRYQFHFSIRQYKNDRDENIDPRLISDQYPILWDVFHQQCLDDKSIVLIKSPSEEEQLQAVTHNAYEFVYITSPSEAIQIAAVERMGNLISHIENPSEAVQLVATKQNFRSITEIKNPSEAAQILAVQTNPYVINYINEPCEEARIIYYIKCARPEKNPSISIQLAAVNRAPKIIEHINRPSEAVQLAAVKQDGLLIQYIKKPTKDVQIAAVAQNPLAVVHIKKPFGKIRRGRRGLSCSPTSFDQGLPVR